MIDSDKAIITEVKTPSQAEKNIQTDYDLSRETYKNMIEKGNEGLENMMVVAINSEHPRAYEVLSGMIKNIADITDKLMDLNKKNAELSKAYNPEKIDATVTNNNVFLGSTTELQKFLIGNEKVVNKDESITTEE